MKSGVYDFFFPTHVHFIDPERWPPLTVQFQGTRVNVLKPISDQTTHRVPGSVADGHLNVYWTIIRLEVSADAPPDGHDLYPLAFECLAWIKVLTRQYWVGLAGSGSASVHGTYLVTDMTTGATEPRGFGTFGTPIITEYLSQETWTQVGDALSSRSFPRTSDLIFCSGMLALRDGSPRESIALLGTACEIELNEWLRVLLSARRDPVMDVLYERSRLDFKWKLNNLVPLLCGRKFSEDVPHWHAELLRLYDSRGAAVHAGVSRDMIVNAPRFVLAADSFLRWSHDVRSASGEHLGPCPLSVQATMGPRA